MKKKLYSLLLLAMAMAAPAHAQWNTNATPRCIFSTTYVDENGDTRVGGDYYACSPKAVRTPDKKTWLSWRTWGRKEVNGISRYAVRTYLQLLNRDGEPQFDEPIMVNDYATTSWWSEYALCVASDGSAIVTVADGRAEEASLTDEQEDISTFSPAIYKIDQEGNFLWGLDGVEYPQYTNAAFTNAFVVGDDTFFIFVNSDYTDESAITYIQRINDDGTTAWDEPRVLLNSMFLQYQILPTDDGDMLFFDHTADGARVQRLNRDLEPQWSEPVIYDDNYYGGHEMNHYRIVPDGQGGACVAFQRFMGEFSHNIRVQHINADGSLAFGLTGLDAYNAEEYDHNYPAIAVNPEKQEILVQFASQLAAKGAVMMQHFTYDGDYLMDDRGFEVASKNDATSGGYYFGLIKTGIGAVKNGDWIVVYRDISSFNKESFTIRRYNNDFSERVWSRTISRDIAPSDVTVIFEDEALYMFYRETKEGKNPGITIFRMGIDGNYDVTYDDGPTVGIDDIERSTSNAQPSTFNIAGQQVNPSRHGLNIVRHADGTTTKQLR